MTSPSQYMGETRDALDIQEVRDKSAGCLFIFYSLELVLCKLCSEKSVTKYLPQGIFTRKGLFRKYQKDG